MLTIGHFDIPFGTGIVFYDEYVLVWGCFHDGTIDDAVARVEEEGSGCEGDEVPGSGVV